MLRSQTSEQSINTAQQSIITGRQRNKDLIWIYEAVFSTGGQCGHVLCQQMSIYEVIALSIVGVVVDMLDVKYWVRIQ